MTIWQHLFGDDLEVFSGETAQYSGPRRELVTTRCRLEG